MPNGLSLKQADIYFFAAWVAIQVITDNDLRNLTEVERGKILYAANEYSYALLYFLYYRLLS